MKEDPNVGEKTEVDNSGRVDHSPSPKVRLPYQRPTLVEYGSVAKLSRGALTTQVEGGTFKMACL